MKMKCTFGLALAMAVSAQAFALDQGDYRLNGYGSVGFTKMGGDESRGFGITGQTTDSWRGEQLSKIGGQLQYGVTDSVTATVLAKVKAEKDDWKPVIDMAYLSWAATDALTLRAGRLGAPIYMYSETLDVGLSYPWLRLPDEVYGAVQLTNVEGIDAIYQMPLSFGALTTQVGVGMAHDRKYVVYDEKFDADYDKAAYVNLLLSTNEFGNFRASFAQTELTTRVEGDVVTPFGPTHMVLSDIDNVTYKFLSLGYGYDNGTWLVNTERTTLWGEKGDSTDSYYVMGGRRFGDFLPHVTYGNTSEGKNRQHSVSYGLNYTVSPKVVVKGEYKKVSTNNTYAGNFSESIQETVDHALNDINPMFGSPATSFDGDIFSVGVDFVF